MPTCKSCSAKVVRTDAFCGTCGEPVPGAKPVVPIARQARPPSGVQAAPERLHGTVPPPAASGGSAPAMAVVALSSEPIERERVSAKPSEVNQTAVRERAASEPAPVLPLRRRKGDSLSEDELRRATSPHGADGAPNERTEASAANREASLPNIPVPARPPILASDLLREQMMPSHPGAKTLRVVTVALSALGLIGAMLAGGIHALTFVSAALLIMMATLALTPMSYKTRAISLVFVGSIATGVALWQQTRHGLSPEGAMLAGATILLSGALLFRAYYRGARLSRFAVALGVTMLGAWFVVSDGHESLVMLEGHWQSWAPASTHMTFGLLGLLSLMAFMESSTRGGAHVWAGALLALYALDVGLLIASEVWPVAGQAASITGPTIAAWLTGIVGTIIAGLALAQVFVAISQAASSRARTSG
ncbi:MAG: hypothetical protein JRE81_00730 [Deltaproteobacteria bacterium]|nr:hypothetical protein [Deltaproteobacteria bacterium]